MKCTSQKELSWDRNRILRGVFCCCLNGCSVGVIHLNSSVEGFLILLTEFCQNPGTTMG